MFLLSCRITLHLADSHSLKDKRRVLNSLMKTLRDRHNVSIVELEDRDAKDRIVLALALVAREGTEGRTRLDRVRRDIEGITQVKYIDFQGEIG